MFLRTLQYLCQNTCVGVCKCNYIEKKLQHRCFSVNVAKFVRTAFCIVFCLLVYNLPNKLSLKKLVFEQINDHMQRKFSKLLTGFRKNYSTQNALLVMIEKWKTILNKKLKAGALFMDLFEVI